MWAGMGDRRIRDGLGSKRLTDAKSDACGDTAPDTGPEGSSTHNIRWRARMRRLAETIEAPT